MTQQALWLVGDYRQPDFAGPVAWLRWRAECHLLALPRYALVAAAIGRQQPAAVVLLESRPGSIPHADIEKLQAALPRASFVALAGPWCEGERRSDRQMTRVVRVPWRAWRWRLESELGWEAAQRAGLCKPLRVLVRTGRRELYESLADGLTHLGLSCNWQERASARQAAAADVLVCDGWEHADKSRSQQPRLLLLHFPRPGDERRAAEEGIGKIVAMPFVLADLAAALNSLCSELA
jgi:hypothetical protein